MLQLLYYWILFIYLFICLPFIFFFGGGGGGGDHAIVEPALPTERV